MPMQFILQRSKKEQSLCHRMSESSPLRVPQSCCSMSRFRATYRTPLHVEDRQDIVVHTNHYVQRESLAKELTKTISMPLSASQAASAPLALCCVKNAAALLRVRERSFVGFLTTSLDTLSSSRSRAE
mmetsp:Transcript_3746/g.8149  ORF Transcript_3746/g.8149 Transcript_3746/m.8149 type:complete len:128 (-) Transcript_3746:1668-2051(-)